MPAQTGALPAQAVALPAQAGADLRVLAQLSESNARISTRIRDIQSLSEREILACGNVLWAIAEKGRDLADESERAVASSMARTEEITSRFARGMQADLLAQETAVQHVLELASGIEAAIHAINDLMLSSKVLAVNARIEAARVGEQGKGFARIADSLSELSGVIRGASDTVSSSIGAVRQGLPQMSASAASMHERTNLFIDEVGKQVESASLRAGNGESNGSLSKLMELSNQALSHLQFQDRMSQNLFAINGDLDLVKERVRQTLNGEEDNPEQAESEIADGSEPLPGEIMLF